METRVVALFVHGDRSSRPEDTGPTPMVGWSEVEVVEGWGIRQDRRYFRPADPGGRRPRQVSLIDEGTIARLEAQHGSIERSFIKAQIILGGDLYLPSLVGARLEFEDGPELTISKEREPCFAMDFITPGMKQAMTGGEQGALAQVTRGGVIRIEQRVVVHQAAEAVAGT
jgi:hypothetical protein